MAKSLKAKAILRIKIKNINKNHKVTVFLNLKDSIML